MMDAMGNTTDCVGCRKAGAGFGEYMVAFAEGDQLDVCLPQTWTSDWYESIVISKNLKLI